MKYVGIENTVLKGVKGILFRGESKQLSGVLAVRISDMIGVQMRVLHHSISKEEMEKMLFTGGELDITVMLPDLNKFSDESWNVVVETMKLHRNKRPLMVFAHMDRCPCGKYGNGKLEGKNSCKCSSENVFEFWKANENRQRWFLDHEFLVSPKVGSKREIKERDTEIFMKAWGYGEYGAEVSWTGRKLKESERRKW